MSIFDINEEYSKLIGKVTALECERDILKRANDEWDSRYKEVIQQRDQLKETLLLGETNFNRLKAELNGLPKDKQP